MNVGSVAAVRRIKNVISVARKVLEHTSHSMLAGDLATKFAVEMGFKEESLSTPSSLDIWSKWIDQKCQPNFWKVIINFHFILFYFPIKIKLYCYY